MAMDISKKVMELGKEAWKAEEAAWFTYQDAMAAWEFREALTEKAWEKVVLAKKAHKKAVRQFWLTLIKGWFQNAYQSLLGFTSRK